MKYILSKQFTKDVDNITDKKILSKIYRVINLIESSGYINELPNVLELVNIKNYYRVKFDYNYRIGISLQEDGALELKRCLTREQFYKKFP